MPEDRNINEYSADELRIELEGLRRLNAELEERNESLNADITQFERTEKLLQEYALAFENISDGLITCDPEGVIQDWNHGAEKTFGYDRDEMLGEPIARIYDPEENESIAPVVRETLAERGRWTGRRKILRKDGTTGYCATVVISLSDDDGLVRKNIGIHYDITERDRAERALQISETRYRRLHAKSRESMRVIRDDLRTARQVQQKTLPSAEQSLTALDYHYAYQPRHRVGGDFFDIAEIRPGVIRALVADAIGHGVQASLITMAIKTEYEALKRHIESPAQVIREMNAHFSANFQSLRIFFPAVLVDIMIDEGKLVYASAGHPEQPVFRPASSDFHRLELTGPYLGMMEPIEIQDAECEFNPGDVLLLYTDGIPESMNAEKEMFGEERMDAVLREHAAGPLDDLIASMLAAEEMFRAGRFRLDDLTLLALRRREA